MILTGIFATVGFCVLGPVGAAIGGSIGAAADASALKESSKPAVNTQKKITPLPVRTRTWEDQMDPDFL